MIVGCKPHPQPVKHLSEEKIDSILLAQMQFTQHIAEAADQICQSAVAADTIHRYAMDEFGFWYTKTIITSGDSITNEQEILLHIQIEEINGPFISDTKINYVLGAGDLPIAITRSLKMMHIGEQILIIAPWYTAYGVEGTSTIKPYSNLSIIITIEK